MLSVTCCTKGSRSSPIGPVRGAGVEHPAAALGERAHHRVVVGDLLDVLRGGVAEEARGDALEVAGRLDAGPQRRRGLTLVLGDGEEAGGRRAEHLEPGRRAVGEGRLRSPVDQGELAAVHLVADDHVAAAEHVAVAQVGPVEQRVLGPVHGVAARCPGRAQADPGVAAAGEAEPCRQALRPADRGQGPHGRQEAGTVGAEDRVLLVLALVADHRAAVVLVADLPEAGVARKEGPRSRRARRSRRHRSRIPHDQYSS